MRHLTGLARLLLLLCIPASTLSAQATLFAGPTVGTILVAHGADSGWNAAVEWLATQVHTGGPVSVAFLMGDGARTHTFQDAVSQLQKAGATRVVVVPILVSSHSGHYEQVRYLTRATDTLDAEMQHHLMMAGIERVPADVPLYATAALDDAPELAHVLADRARAIATAPARQAVVLIGHGPNSAEDNAAWMVNLRAVADSIRSRGGFADVQVGLVRDDAPAAVRAEAVVELRELITLENRATGQPVVVIPILIANGGMSRTTLPGDVAGLPVVYAGTALLPHAELARWVERRVREAVRSGK
jgi:sirohydrochlorin ferrochelatase